MSESTMLTEKTVKLLTFDGTASTFQMWWTRFMAFAALNKFAEVVQRYLEANLPQAEDDLIDETTAAGKLQALAKKRNATAFASLTMARPPSRSPSK